MELNINYIQIGKTRQTLTIPQWISGWNPSLKPEVATQIPQTNDGTQHWRNVEEWLRPEIDFTYNFRNVNQYSEAAQILILGAFICRFYMPEIKMWFIGQFKLIDSSVALFLRTAGNEYKGVTNYTFKAKSVFTYDSWQQLKDKANIDSRF